MDGANVEKHALKANLHTPGTTLLCLENTHNRAGGAIIPLDAMAAYRGVADRTGMKIHLDGARVFNASVALGVDVSEITKHVDSVNFCLSKGLRSLVGSLLCGTQEFIYKARIWRKRLGGGMRQAGILAACGIVSLTKNVDRLAEDHRRAKEISRAISEFGGFRVDAASVETNMVMVQTDQPAPVVMQALADKGIWCLPTGVNTLRLVLHADIDDAKVGRAIAAFGAWAG